MTDTSAEELKNKLLNAINRRMHVMKEGKTEAITAIAAPLDVQPRQVYMWLKGTLPHNAQSIMLSLDTMINEMDKFKSDIRNPAVPTTAHMSLPFRVVIPRQNLKFSQDEAGNIIIHGSLSVDLL